MKLINLNVLPQLLLHHAMCKVPNMLPNKYEVQSLSPECSAVEV